MTTQAPTDGGIEWGWVVGGVAVVVLAGVGTAYGVSRRRRDEAAAAAELDESTERMHL